jgi:UDP-N-acetylglucosamine 3-dehydrogenase
VNASVLDLAFVGCGAATAMHSRTLRRFPAIRRHYASRDADKAAAFARRWGGAGYFRGYDGALEDPAIDIVLVATPPALHLVHVLSALDRGKHVIVEKPAFMSTGELDRAAAQAERAGCRLFVAENYAYKPLADALRRVVEGGSLGEIRFIHVNALKRQRTGDWRDDPALAGGGALFEGGVHWLSLLGSIGLTVTRARAVPAGPDPVSRGRSALVVLEYQEGAVATLSYSWDIPSPLQGLRLSRIFGTRSCAAFESNGLFLATGPRSPSIRLPGVRDLLGYRAMFTDFIDALRTERPPRFTLERARRDLELLEAVREPASPDP